MEHIDSMAMLAQLIERTQQQELQIDQQQARQEADQKLQQQQARQEAALKLQLERLDQAVARSEADVGNALAYLRKMGLEQEELKRQVSELTLSLEDRECQIRDLQVTCHGRGATAEALQRATLEVRALQSKAEEKVKQLSQELQVEKQKTGQVEALMREQHVAMQKELGSMQAKTQSGYQELQAMQIKRREQLEGQISRLQQENSILRDAVSSAANQMESKNSAELNKVRSENSVLMKELTETKGKLQQEEHQRKSLEVGFKQNVSQLEAQLQDTQRRWEELLHYLHKVNAERVKLQSAKQELQNQLLAVEAELNSKCNEIQNLHGSLTEALVSKERVEQRVLQLLEVTQHSIPDETLQTQVQELINENKGLQVQIESLQHQNDNLQAQMSSQATHISHCEELQKLLAEKELQRKSLEDALNAERSSGASRKTKMQAMHNESMALKTELQNLQAQITEQNAFQLALEKSVQELEELSSSIKVEFVPLQEHEEARLNMVKAQEELEDKLVEASERLGKAEAQVQQLVRECASLHSNINSLQGSSEKHKNEIETFVSQNAELVGQLQGLQKECKEREGDIARLTEQKQSQGYVPKQQNPSFVQQQSQGYVPQQQSKGYVPQQQSQGYVPQSKVYVPQQQSQVYVQQSQAKGDVPKQQQSQGYMPKQQQSQSYVPQHQSESYVPKQQSQQKTQRQHEQAKRDLSAALETTRVQTSKLEAKEKESGEELKNVEDGSNMLKEKVEKVLSEMEKDYVSLKEHEAVMVKLSTEAVEAQIKAKEMSEMYAMYATLECELKTQNDTKAACEAIFPQIAMETHQAQMKQDLVDEENRRVTQAKELQAWRMETHQAQRKEDLRETQEVPAQRRQARPKPGKGSRGVSTSGTRSSYRRTAGRYTTQTARGKWRSLERCNPDVLRKRMATSHRETEGSRRDAFGGCAAPPSRSELRGRVCGSRPPGSRGTGIFPLRPLEGAHFGQGLAVRLWPVGGGLKRPNRQVG